MELCDHILEEHSAVDGKCRLCDCTGFVANPEDPAKLLGCANLFGTEEDPQAPAAEEEVPGGDA